MWATFFGKSPPPPQPPGQATSSESPASQGQDMRTRMKEVALASLEILEATSTVASELGDVVGVPLLKPGLLALSEVLRRIQEMRDTVEGVDTLHEHISSLSRMLINCHPHWHVRSQPLSGELPQRLERLSNKWITIADRARGITDRRSITRLLTAKADAKKLKGLVEEINNSIQEELELPGLLNIEVGVDDLRRDVGEVHQDIQVVADGVKIIRQEGEVVREDVGIVREDVGVVREDVKVIRGDITVIEAGITDIREDFQTVGRAVERMIAPIEESFMPTYAKGAQFDANNIRSGCLEGTRTDLLKALQEWIIAVCLQKSASNIRIVYWINGLAGTGKTTIAYSIAAWCRQKGLLGASFFCSRFDVECSDPNSVFRTVSRQLCHFSAPFKEKVAAILAKDSTIVHSGASRQFEELILRPLEELECDFPRCVVVIDALDECKDPNTVSVILSIIAKSVPRIAAFLVFVITSRPERRITHLFDSNEYGALKAATTPFMLHMVDLKSVSDDIHRYLKKRLAGVRDYFQLKDWPSPPELSKLAELSTGLFVWAATAVRFIMDDAVSDPEGQLQVLLSIKPTKQGTAESSGTILDPLYSQIVWAALPTLAKALSQHLQSILGTIVLAKEPISMAVLEGLTGKHARTIRISLLRLGSVLYIPNDDDEPIRIIHPTFAEFLLQSSPSKPEAFVIDATAQHRRLFSRTLNIIDGLKPNIVHLPMPSMFRKEVAGLGSTVQEKIPAVLSYSCRHWSAHLEQCHDAEQIGPTLALLNKFFYERLLNWLEACALLGLADGSIAALQVARKACQKYGVPFVLLTEFIVDCLRFTQTYYASIDAAPLQVYHSLLSLAPVASLVKQQYAQKLDQSLLITRGALSDWGPCIAAFSGHCGFPISSVSLSADGAYFATGGKDGYIRIWRTATRRSVKVIPVAGGEDHRVAFSPSGMHVASAPGLRIRDVKTGVVVHTLEHEGASYVAYSADGSRLASGSDKEIKLWDTATGTCLDTIASLCAKWGMAISSDGSLVGGSNVEDHAAVCTSISQAAEVLDPEDLTAIAALSPDGKYAVSGASTTVTVWALERRSALRAIHASSDIWAVAFSHDSTQIGCGCSDGRVRIWTVVSTQPPRVFSGHTGIINSLAWSPDDTQVISVSEDGTIRVWDLTRHRVDITLAVSSSFSLPPLLGAPGHAVIRTPKTTALFSVPAYTQPFPTASDAAKDAPIIVLHADMADAWDAILRGGQALGEFAASQDWAFLTGRLHANMKEIWPVAMTLDGSLYAYESSRATVEVHNRRTGDHLTIFLGWAASAITFSPNDPHVAIATSISNSLDVYDTTSQFNLPIRTFQLGSSSSAIAYSQDGSLLVAGTDDGDVHICDTTIRGSNKRLHSTRGSVKRITFSADDRHIIAQAHPWSIIWDVATGDQILEFSPTHHNLLRSFDFAADDTGILVPDGKGRTTKVILWSPGERRWPVYTVTEDGWLYTKSPGKVRRLCWLPLEWRAVFPLGGPRLCAADAEQRRAVVFDVSRIPEYVEMWGEGSETCEK